MTTWKNKRKIRAHNLPAERQPQYNGSTQRASNRLVNFREIISRQRESPSGSLFLPSALQSSTVTFSEAPECCNFVSSRDCMRTKSLKHWHGGVCTSWRRSVASWRPLATLQKIFSCCLDFKTNLWRWSQQGRRFTLAGRTLLFTDRPPERQACWFLLTPCKWRALNSHFSRHWRPSVGVLH